MAESHPFFLVVKEMGLTPEAFLRGLPGLMQGNSCQEEDGQLRLTLPVGEIRIRLVPLPPRRLASLELPVTRVEFDLSELNEEAAKAFMKRFELHYHRGGG